MIWSIEFHRSGIKDLKKIDPVIQKQIIRFLKTRIEYKQSPKSSGKALKGRLAGLWRYRVGDYRVICHINPHDRRVIILRIAHRSKVYS